MSSKQKKQSRRKGNKYKTSKSNTKTRNSITKKTRNTKKKNKKKRTSVSSTTSHSNHKSKTDFSSTGLSLSPFYSFSNHWSYITRQYLCLSTWGTCMGGINEQYDDLLDQEASIPLAEESYKKAIDKWRKEKQNIQKYNRENNNKYERIRDEQLENAYNITNKNNTYNEYNVFNYPMTPKRNVFQKQQIQQQKQQQIAPIIKPMARQINYVQSHKVPEYSYIPNKFKQANIENVKNTENIYNVFNTYNTINNENENEYNMFEDNENIYNKPSNVKYDKAANIDNDNYSGNGYQETMQSQNIYPNNESAESKQDLEDKMYKSGSDGSGSIGDNEESKSNDNENENENRISPQLIKKQNISPQFLSSPDQGPQDDPHHMKAKSFGRKFSMFEEAAQIKKRKTIEENEWKEQHHSGGDVDEDGQYRPHDGNGVQYIQEFTYHPAAHHVQPHMPRKMSTKEYSNYMKEKEEPDAIVTDNDVAALPAKDKIKLFTMLSTEKSIEKQ